VTDGVLEEGSTSSRDDPIVIEAVVFDLGGVFTDSPFEAIRALGRDKGADFDQAMHIVFGPYDDDTDHPWHRAERGELDITTTRSEIRELGRAAGYELDLFEMLRYMSSDGGSREDVVATTRRVRAEGLRTGLVTNNVKEFREFWEPLLPLVELFDVVIDSSEVGVRKPDPRIYRLVLHELGGVAPERAVFLDDYPGNVAAARRLGMHGIVVEPDPSEALAELDRLLASATRP
jgi:putative hydrolase of the HAD superfamily